MPIASVDLRTVAERLELAEQLRQGRDAMLEPQDLPGRYGRVVQAVDRVLAAVGTGAVLAGGWAVWRHGYIGRVTQDVDVVLAAGQVDQFLRAAAVAGFDVLAVPPGRWPKALHRETGIQVDVLPEGKRPGTAAHPAPTTIPAPSAMGAEGTLLRFIRLESLIELKLAAGRTRDQNDVAELIAANPDRLADIRAHLGAVHADYVAAFDELAERARDQGEP
jgi:hypothetical protein